MKNIKYHVTYKYYKYNSGQADNGAYWKSIEFESFDEAKYLFSQINSSINKELLEADDDKLINNYIPYHGFFEEVKLFKLKIEEIFL